MKLVLWGVSPVGLGHASRAVAISQELEGKGLRVVFATGGGAVEHLSSHGLQVRDAIREPNPTVRGGEMKAASLWYARYWYGYRRSRTAMRRLIEELGPDLVVGDEEFSGVSLALEGGIKQALITDELELGFAKSPVARSIERRVGRWYGELQERVSALIIPDYGEDSKNRHFVTPIVRRVTAERPELARKFSLPEEGDMVLFVMSGAGVGGWVLRRTVEAFRRWRPPGAFLVVVGNRGGRISGDGIYDLGVVRDGQNLVAAASLVVSTAGKSTIDEAASAGTPIIAIPVRNHMEQEGNARELGFGPADLSKLEELMAERIGRRLQPGRCEGAARSAELLIRMAG
jgi:UDP-N-acetylglucosamine--N-acetylmuramyl-(pentapeptide) pyrophosphoryl-undecaprenol N-acetylglucosamine transferase